MKTTLTISIDGETRDKAKELLASRGQKLSPIIELYLNKLLEKKEHDAGI